MPQAFWQVHRGTVVRADAIEASPATRPASCTCNCAAEEYGGVCHMRFDDTNPEKEEMEYVDGIKDAVKWLGYGWDANGTSHLYQASDYFDFMYRAAEYLIEAGLAYVDEQTPEEMRANRGDFSHARHRQPVPQPQHRREPARASARCATASWPMAPRCCAPRSTWPAPTSTCGTRPCTASSMRSTTTPATSGASTRCTPSRTRSRTRWRTSPTAICTLEFEDQRPFYDWLLDRLAEGGLINTPHPRQYEFARLNLTYVITSKRKLKQLVDEKHVSGWDDPRMPTIVGLRRRGYTPEACSCSANASA
jgi:glutaminyl-tRNA synthetase